MTARFVDVPSARILEAIKSVGYDVQFETAGSEVVARLRPDDLPYSVRIFTTVSTIPGGMSKQVRECGQDAVRLLLVLDSGQFTYLVAAPAEKILRTAPNDVRGEEWRVRTFCERLRGRIEALIQKARTIPTCPTCAKPMMVRSSRGSDFFGCSRYPECRATLSLRERRNVA